MPNCTENDYNNPSHPCFFEDSGKQGEWVTTTKKMDEEQKINTRVGLSGNTTLTNRSFTDITSPKTGVGLSGNTAVTNRNLTDIVASGQASKVGLLDANGNVKQGIVDSSPFTFDFSSTFANEDWKKATTPIDFSAFGKKEDTAQKQTFWQKNGKTILIVLGVILSVGVVWHFLADEKIKPAAEGDVLLDLRKAKK